MKTLTLFLMLFALTAVGCHHRVGGVKGSGNRVVQKRDVPAFTSISTGGAFDVEVVVQKTQSVEIEGDDNILPLISSEVSGNKLSITSNSNFSVGEPLRIRISVPDLVAVDVSGAGKFEVSGVKNEKFDIDCNGAPVLKVSGSTKTLNIDVNGAAKIDAQGLHASTGVIESKGISKIDVDVKDHLDVTISGPSVVTYKGDPTVNKTINGPGKAEKRESEGAFEIRMANENRGLRVANCEACHSQTIAMG
ncbi:MAG TPA: head GIN domain-containing protein [Pyrinomonadaceae bacterium]